MPPPISLLTNAASAIVHDALPAAKNFVSSGKLSELSSKTSKEAMEALKSTGTKLQNQLTKAVGSGPASALINDAGKFGLDTAKLKNAVKLTQAKLNGLLNNTLHTGGAGEKPGLVASLPMSGGRLQNLFKKGAGKKEEAAKAEDKPGLAEAPHSNGKPQIATSDTEKPATSALDPEHDAKVSEGETNSTKPQHESVELEGSAVSSEEAKPGEENHKPTDSAQGGEVVKPHYEDEGTKISIAQDEGKTEVLHEQGKPELPSGGTGKTDESHGSQPPQLSAHGELENATSAHEQLHGMISEAENSLNAAESKINQNPQAGKNSHLAGILSDLRAHLNQIKSNVSGRIPSMMNGASSMLNKLDMPSLMQAGNSLFQAAQIGLKMIAENILAHAQMLAEINKMANAAMVAAV